MKKEDKIIVMHLAHREKDHVTLDEDGLINLRLLLQLGRRERNRFFRAQDKGILNEWSDTLRHFDKYVERLFWAAKKVIVEVDWNKWADLEKELTAENKRLNR